jgi:hypothetical protein
MDDVSSRIVEREDGPARPRRRRPWVLPAATLVAGLLAGFAIGSTRGADPAELDAARERAVRAERQVVFLRGERDRLNGQIADNARLIERLEVFLASR